MPFFDFHCRDCNQNFERLVRGDTTPTCPHCGSTKLNKQLPTLSAPAKSKSIIACARAQAASEGHFSNFSASERKKLLKG